MFINFPLWFPMLFLAVINGSVRDLVYKKYMGELTAHQISTISLLILFVLYIAYVIHRFPPHSASHAISIGISWLLLTLIFELGFGRLRGNSWSQLWEDYKLAKGRLWVLIPIWVSMAP